VVTNPGISKTLMGTLPSRRPNSTARSNDCVCAVSWPRTTSTTLVVVTGYRKCMPDDALRASLLWAASSVIDSVEVLITIG
jgi:hypothetical protein